MILNIVLALLIGFSYKIIEQIIMAFSEKQAGNTIYYWAIWLFSASFFYKGNFIFHLPRNTVMSLPLVISVIVVSFIVTKYFHYHPEGTRNQVNYLLLFPILEEITYRGIILPLLMKGTILGKWVTPLNIIMLSPAIIVSALLFALSYLQYLRWNKKNAGFILLMFGAGLLYGIIAQVTHSIVFAVIMHLAFNLFAFWRGGRAAKVQDSSVNE